MTEIESRKRGRVRAEKKGNSETEARMLCQTTEGKVDQTKENMSREDQGKRAE